MSSLFLGGFAAALLSLILLITSTAINQLAYKEWSQTDTSGTATVSGQCKWIGFTICMTVNDNKHCEDNDYGPDGFQKSGSTIALVCNVMGITALTIGLVMTMVPSLKEKGIPALKFIVGFAALPALVSGICIVEANGSEGGCGGDPYYLNFGASGYMEFVAFGLLLISVAFLWKAPVEEPAIPDSQVYHAIETDQ